MHCKVLRRRQHRLALLISLGRPRHRMLMALFAYGAVSLFRLGVQEALHALLAALQEQRIVAVRRSV